MRSTFLITTLMLLPAFISGCGRDPAPTSSGSSKKSYEGSPYVSPDVSTAPETPREVVKPRYLYELTRDVTLWKRRRGATLLHEGRTYENESEYERRYNKGGLIDLDQGTRTKTYYSHVSGGEGDKEIGGIRYLRIEVASGPSKGEIGYVPMDSLRKIKKLE